MGNRRSSRLPLDEGCWTAFYANWIQTKYMDKTGCSGSPLRQRLPSAEKDPVSFDQSNAQLSGGRRCRQNIVSCRSGVEPDTKDRVGRIAQPAFGWGSCCRWKDSRAAPGGVGAPL